MSLLEQLDTVNKIFLDTAPVIYFVEKNPSFAIKVQPIFDRLDGGELKAVVSPITLAECLVLPYKLGTPILAQIFTELLVNSPSVTFNPVDSITADKAAELRARYNLTLIDAFQIATAMQAGCDAFLTNDIELKQIKEIQILILSD
jgi:predicted nucleic acid-binding protein